MPRIRPVRAEGQGSSDPHVPSSPGTFGRNGTGTPSEEPGALDDATQRFLHHLFEHAPELLVAGELARRFAALIRGDDSAALDQWIADAAGTELDALAKGIRRDIDAVKAAITHPWSTSPVEGRINRLKTLKRQMYGRAGYELLRSRLLAAA